MYNFKQSTGQFRETHLDRIGPDTIKLLSTGYAGREQGKNNPSMESVKGLGPLPRGRYFPKKLFDVHPTVGKFAILLEPDAETRATIIAYGRNPDSFFMHGDSSEHPGLASHGCIVEPRPTREYVWANPDWIEVTS